VIFLRNDCPANYCTQLATKRPLSDPQCWATKRSKKAVRIDRNRHTIDGEKLIVAKKGVKIVFHPGNKSPGIPGVVPKKIFLN
jgi:hypothetical protein